MKVNPARSGRILNLTKEMKENSDKIEKRAMKQTRKTVRHTFSVLIAKDMETISPNAS